MDTTFSNITNSEENDTLYSSALENLSGYENANTSTESNRKIFNNSRQIEIDELRALNTILQSQDSFENTEVDPKSQLANKTIFKTNNPNLSIIEISDISTKDEENSVYLVEPDDIEIRRKYSGKKNKLDIRKSPSDSAFDSGRSETSSISPSASSEPALKEEKKESPRILRVFENLEEFEKNLPPTVSVLTTPFGSRVYLVGTAHFSEESQDDVSFVIRNVKPDIVMVELCAARTHMLRHDEKTLLEEAKSFSLAKIRNIINTNGLVNGVFFMLLLHMSAQLVKELGMAPGGEFRRAYEEVQKIPGCMLHLGDRPINITLRRALRALSLWQTIKLVWRLTSTESISVQEVEECKQRDLLEKLLEEMSGEFPEFSKVFVKERDLYLCHSLQVAALPQSPPTGNGPPRPIKVVGVVGIGHAAGITENWGKVDPSKIPEILEIPPARLSTRILKFTVKYGLIGLTLYGVYKFIRPKIKIVIK